MYGQVAKNNKTLRLQGSNYIYIKGICNTNQQ